MPRHRHHRRDHSIPPIPPIPPFPPLDTEGAYHFGFDDLRRLFASRGRGWRGDWGPFHFDFDFRDGEGGGGGRRGRRSRRMFEGGELRLVLLKLIADQPRHGYELIKAIEELTGGEYAPSPGVVYPTLTLLEDMGLIAEKKTKDAKKMFEATDEGRAHLAENEAEVEELMERLEGLAPPERPEAGPAIGRAIKNLMTAMGQRIGRDGPDSDMLIEIAHILDDAAQRIERMK
jgi:DNA-binding PadR family transcriptional regulator